MQEQEYQKEEQRARKQEAAKEVVWEQSSKEDQQERKGSPQGEHQVDSQGDGSGAFGQQEKRAREV